MRKPTCYAVVRGRVEGIFNQWFGPHGAEAQIKAYAGAVYKGFPTLDAATQWYTGKTGKPPAMHFSAQEDNLSNRPPGLNRPLGSSPAPAIQSALEAGKVVIFTDGACTGNPGPGGYAAVLLFGDQRAELSGGYRLTTNNRMELMACIRALESLKSKSAVILYSDSRYVVDGITKGWARRWKQRGWKKLDKQDAVNPDLWDRLLDLCNAHEVVFTWVEGHAGVAENERCDQLSVAETQKPNLPPDTGYENPQKFGPTQPTFGF